MAQFHNFGFRIISPKWRWPPSLRHDSHAHDAPPDTRAEPSARAETAGLVKRVLDVSTVNPTSPNTAPAAPPGATIPHEPHFIIGENVKLTTREVNLALASQLAGSRSRRQGGNTSA